LELNEIDQSHPTSKSENSPSRTASAYVWTPQQMEVIQIQDLVGFGLEKVPGTAS
jgi:hypothetical protein